MSDHWKSLADRLGAPGLDPSVRRSRESATQPSSPPAPVVPATSTKTSRSEEGAGHPSQPSVIAQQKPTIDSSTDVPKKKKRSNWERVANLFGLGSEPEVFQQSPLDAEGKPPQHGDAPPSSSASQNTSPPSIPAVAKGQKTGQFVGATGLTELFESTSKDDSNPVLAEMFGHTQSAFPDSWESPKRVVDDLGWEEPPEVWEDGLSKGESDDDPTSGDAVDRLETEDATDEAEAPRRRSRRRRRGGRRGGSGSGSEPHPGSSVPARRSGFEASEIAPSIEDASNLSGPSDDEGPSETDLAERRSSRRRRHRSGGRFNETTSEEVRSDLGSDELPEVLDEDSSGTIISEPARRDNDQEDEGSRQGTRRRRKRPRGGRGERSEREDRKPEDAFAPAFPAEEDDLEEDDDPQTADRHGHKPSRSIPTWEETLSVLITTNIENHRRNENRGSRGGGRFKGRR